MSPQDKVLSSNTGKAREPIAGTSGSSPSGQVLHDDQGSDKCGKVSPLDLSKLSTIPPLDKVNNKIDRWLSNTEIPSGSANQSVENQENAQLSSDPGSGIQDELTKELRALTKRPFNAKGKSGTSAPANTPQSEDCDGLRTRSQSTGDAQGRRVCMGPQAKTMEEGDLPIQAKSMKESDVPRPLFSKSNSSIVAGTSTSLPQAKDFSTTPDEVKSISSELPNKSVKRIPSPCGPAQTSDVVETNISTSPAAAIAQTSQTFQNATSLPALAGPATNNASFVKHVLEQHQGIPPTAAHLLMDSVTGRPSALTHAAPSPSPPVLPGSTVNAYGLAQPPSPLRFQQHAQHDLQRPVPASAAPHLGGFVGEAESINDSPDAPRFQSFSGIGRQHSPHASTVMWSARPESRGKRILQDFQQLWNDCFCRCPAMQPSAIESDPGDIGNTHRYGSHNANIFERAGDNRAEQAESCPQSLDGRLRKDASSPLDGELGCDASRQQSKHTSSNESSNTAQEATNDPHPSTNVCARPKNIFQRWKARRVAAARERARLRRGDSNNVKDPDMLASAGMIP